MDYSRTIGPESRALRSVYTPKLAAFSCGSSTLLGPGFLRSSPCQRRVTSHLPSVASAPAAMGTRTPALLHRSLFPSRPVSHCPIVDTGRRGSRSSVNEFGQRGTRGGLDISDPGRVHRLVRSFSSSTCVLDSSTSTSRRLTTGHVSRPSNMKYHSDRKSSYIKVQTIREDGVKSTEVSDKTSKNVEIHKCSVDNEKHNRIKDKKNMQMITGQANEESSDLSFQKVEFNLPDDEVPETNATSSGLYTVEKTVKQREAENVVTTKPTCNIRKKSEINPSSSITSANFSENETNNECVKSSFKNELVINSMETSSKTIDAPLLSPNVTDEDGLNLNKHGSNSGSCTISRRASVKPIQLAEVHQNDVPCEEILVLNSHVPVPARVESTVNGKRTKYGLSTGNHHHNTSNNGSTLKPIIPLSSIKCDNDYHNYIKGVANSGKLTAGNKECCEETGIEISSRTMIDCKERFANKENKERPTNISSKVDFNLVGEAGVAGSGSKTNTNTMMEILKDEITPGLIEASIISNRCNNLKKPLGHNTNGLEIELKANECTNSDHQNTKIIKNTSSVIEVEPLGENSLHLCPIPELTPKATEPVVAEKNSRERTPKLKLKKVKKSKTTNLDDTKESENVGSTENAKTSSTTKRKRAVKKSPNNVTKEECVRLTPEQQAKIDRLTRFRERGQRTKLIIERMKMEDDPVSYMKNESNVRFALKIKQQELLKQQQQGSSGLCFTNPDSRWPDSLEKYSLQYGPVPGNCVDASEQRSGLNPLGGPVPKYRVYSIEDFTLLRVLGEGGFGKVILGQMRGTSNYFAVKCLKKSKLISDEDYDDVTTEQKVLTLATNHSFLCHLFCTFQTSTHLFFILEFLNGGDLNFHLHRLERFPAEMTRFYAAEIVCGLKFLHKKGIIYRDLKLDNVLLDYQGHIRLADFGMCITKIFLDRTANTFCGTVDYMAPEMILGRSYNQSVDWWSFGVLLYEMLVGLSPFYGLDEQELFLAIRYEEPYYPKFMQGSCVDIIKWLLQKDPVQRLGSSECPAGPVTSQPFLGQLNWLAVENKQLRPPLVPQLREAADCRHFDEKYTEMSVVLTQHERNSDQETTDGFVQDRFAKFVYTNPNLTD